MIRKIPAFLLMLAAGMITAIPVAVPELFFVGIVSFALPVYVEYTMTGKGLGIGRTYLRGLSFFMGFGIVVFSWFCALYPLEFAGISKGAAVAVVCAGWFGLSLLQALFWALMFVVTGLLSRLCGTKKHPLLYSLVFTCTYVVFEWMTTKTWAAVPWGRLAVGQTEFLPMIQISSVLGSYAVSFILVFFGAVLGVAIHEYISKRDRKVFRPLILAAAILVANILFGTIRVMVYEVPEESTKVTAAVLQGNISSHEKWSSDSYEAIKENYKELSEDAAEDGAEMIILPETPLAYNMDEILGDDMKEYYHSIAASAGGTVVTGAFTKNDDGISENSVVVFESEKGMLDGKYVKRHLVPFGEYVPMRDFVSVVFPPLSDIGMLADDLSQGSEPTLFETKYGKIAPIICFDSIYETLALDSVRAGGELITLSTNDSWFLDSPGVWEHNRHAKLRSIECGRYTVRSANTGVSSVISPTGEVMEVISPLERGYAVADVYMIDELTPYTVIGNAFIPICFLCVIVASAYCSVKKNGKEEE